MIHFADQSVRDCFSPFASVQHAFDGRLRSDEHLRAASTYLMRTIEACDGKASSKGYSALKGWMPAYPETTGYIVPTLYNLSDYLDDPIYANTAQDLGRWLLSIQLDSGGFVGREEGVTREPIVFNTGMILLGLTTLAARTESQLYIDAARRAGDFLMDCQDETYCFVRHLSNGIVHTYNVRSAWALCKLGKQIGDDKYMAAGLGNADWTLTQQLDNGYFSGNQFKVGGQANTHGLGYILRGLLEIYALSGDAVYLDGVRISARQVCRLYDERGHLAANFDEDWNFTTKHICLTGCAQLAIVLLKLAAIDDDLQYQQVGEALIRDVAATQNLHSKTANHYGAIKGSYPIYGAYAPLQYPNWASKFFIDALLELGKTDR